MTEYLEGWSSSVQNSKGFAVTCVKKKCQTWEEIVPKNATKHEGLEEVCIARESES